MKVRVITGVLGGLFAIAALVLFNYPFLGIFVALFTGMAVYEVERMAKVTNIPLIALSLAVSLFIPLALEYGLLEKITLYVPLSIMLTAYVIAALLLTLAFFETTRFEHVCVALVASLAIPYAMACLLLIKNAYREEYPKAFFVLFTGLASAWITDAGAYFTGIKLGKHKMSPKISPKKTIEGAVGGILVSALFNLITFLFFDHFSFKGGWIPFWLVLLVSVLLSLAGMAGDLSASVIKRNYGEKDFGAFFPGHGGVMDRFDSTLFVLPCLYAVVQLTGKI